MCLLQICKHVCKEERQILNTAQVVKDDHFAQYENQDSGKVQVGEVIGCIPSGQVPRSCMPTCIPSGQMSAVEARELQVYSSTI
jgi:hypothetical protein